MCNKHTLSRIFPAPGAPEVTLTVWANLADTTPLDAGSVHDVFINSNEAHCPTTFTLVEEDGVTPLSGRNAELFVLDY